MQNLLDKLNAYNVNKNKINEIKKQIFDNKMKHYRKAREKQSIRDYESLSIIGRGAFGEVHVCREKKTGKIVAIKKIKKEILIIKNQIIHVRNEQLFLSNVKSPWIVDLKASFQEDDYLYLVMEFCPGGDLMNLLIEKDILTEKEAKFYLAELILSIESIHKFDCIHRDIKPDNVLIDENGHIKLSDFGLAKISERIFENRKDINSTTIFHHNKNYSCVGTAYYVAPEVLNKKGYGPEIDWWSAGIIFYEMLVGYAPFCSKNTSEVCYKVRNWKKYFKIPSNIKISSEAKDLIIKLINNPNKRLGKNGAAEIKSHPFFKDLDWDNIRKMKPPFIPNIKDKTDTKYFETFEELEPFYPKPLRIPKRKDIEYLGYTYKEDSDIINENIILDNVKKIIVNEESKISNTNYTSSGSGIIPPHKNNFKSFYPKASHSTSKNSKKGSKNEEIVKTERILKDPRLNIIKLPIRKSKMSINKKKDSFNIINKVNTSLKNNKNKINIGWINKKVKKLSPNPKADIILKILNYSKIKNQSKSKSNSRNKKIPNQSCSKNSNNNKDQLFNNNDTKLLKILLKKSISNKNIKKKIVNKKQNNLKIINNSLNKK